MGKMFKSFCTSVRNQDQRGVNLCISGIFMVMFTFFALYLINKNIMYTLCNGETLNKNITKVSQIGTFKCKTFETNLDYVKTEYFLGIIDVYDNLTMYCPNDVCVDKKYVKICCNIKYGDITFVHFICYVFILFVLISSSIIFYKLYTTVPIKTD
uniref:Uncharacterized protein n=1 Tax=viral metagenome TaxID=1070528 RepID=A0A6C0JSM7_9ZZZZ